MDFSNWIALIGITIALWTAIVTHLTYKNTNSIADTLKVVKKKERLRLRKDELMKELDICPIHFSEAVDTVGL